MLFSVQSKKKRKKVPKKFVNLKKVSTFASSKTKRRSYKSFRSLAQLVEQLTLNQWVQGSIPWRPTKRCNSALGIRRDG